MTFSKKPWLNRFYDPGLCMQVESWRDRNDDIRSPWGFGNSGQWLGVVGERDIIGGGKMDFSFFLCVFWLCVLCSVYVFFGYIIIYFCQ